MKPICVSQLFTYTPPRSDVLDDEKYAGKKSETALCKKFNLDFKSLK